MVNKLFRKMYAKALLREGGHILPCGSKKTHEESFVVDRVTGVAIFTYDKENHSTGTIICPLCKETYDACKHIVERIENEIKGRMRGEA